MKIRVVTKEPGQLAKVEIIENSLGEFKRLIGDGYLEVRSFPDSLFAFYCNEDGKRLKLRPNFVFPPGDFIVGSIVAFAGVRNGIEIGFQTQLAAEKVVAILNELSI